MNWSEVVAIMALIMVVNGAFAWAIKLLLNADRKKIEGQIKSLIDRGCDNRDRIDALKTEFSEMRESLPREYVRREDWILGFGRVEHKIDSIWRFIHDNFQKRGC